MGDLPANGLERQMAALLETATVGGAADDRDAAAGNTLAVGVQCLPLPITLFQLCHCAAGQQADIGVPQQRLTENRRAGPAGARKEQSVALNAEAGEGAGLFRINAVQKTRRVALFTQLAMARSLLVIGTQLQHTAGRPA